MTNGFRLKARLPADPEAIYRAWLSSREHSAMTGARATASTRKGGRFTAWDGYIRGRNLKLRPQWCIVQAWRTTQFSPRDPDSRIELCIHRKGKGAEVLLIHTGLPPRQAAGYRSGWRSYYFTPMRKYFAEQARAARKPAKRRPRKAAARRRARR
jgi:activator of HSP90 ATPase